MSTNDNTSVNDRDVLRFQLNWRDGAYHVSKPNIDSMEVVAASDYDALLKRYEDLQASF